jgi:arylsulfatase A-like enzyme
MHFAKSTAAALVFFLSDVFILADPPNDHAEARQVVVIVWDGMRPDFVQTKYAPTLAALAREGVFFRNNHSSYPTSTNVNGAVLATGDYPAHDGIISNQEYRAEIDPLRQFDTSDFPALDAVDGKINAKYLAVPTVAEILQKAGYRTAVAGSKPIAQLADRSRKRLNEKPVVIYRGHVLPRSAEAAIAAAIGPFPKRNGKPLPNIAEDAWTTRALTEVLWKEGVPKFSLLWLSEPDLSQHEFAPGSPTALAAIKSDDENLAKVRAALRARNALTSTDIFVVSDHGFSTIDLALDATKRLRAAGFNAVRFFTEKPKPRQILVVSLGGSMEFYVVGHAAALTKKLVDYLQHSDFAGVIFTREKMNGTFTLAQVHLATATAPDVIVSARWNDRPNEFGAPGEVASDLGKNLDQGTHSTLSPHDLYNTLVASGPDFRSGWNDEIPTGNIDVAPTILALLGLKSPEPMEGRIFTEALRKGKSAPAVHEQELVAERKLGDATWRQTLRLTTVGTTTYVSGGNGGIVGEKP